ncbi:MAG: hypothetical protein WB493_00245 [Anaeromyxobacteraceae bacterium]
MAPALAALAAVLLAMALAVSAGMFHETGLLLVACAGIASLAGTQFPAPPRTDVRPAIAILGLGLAASWVLDLLYLPGILVNPARLGMFRPLLATAGVVLLSYALRGLPRPAARIRYPLLVALGTGLAATVILASPRPSIDVWFIQQQGAAGLLAGKNPYQLLYPNIYGPGTPYLDPSLLTPDGRYITAYPYMPLPLLLDVAGFLVGDIRWTMLAGMAASALLIGRLGRGAVAAELAGTLLLFQPQNWMVAEMAWTDPLALTGLLLVVLVVTRRAANPADGAPPWTSWVLSGVAAGLAVSTKQYVPLLVAPFLLLLPRGARLRAAAVATAVALAILAPFLLLDPSALVRGVLEFQLRQPFREDALSVPAFVYRLGGPKLPPWPAFLIAGATLAISVWRGIAPGRLMLGVAATWIAFVSFNKQAFANYYWLGVGLLCAAVALFAAPDESL